MAGGLTNFLTLPDILPGLADFHGRGQARSTTAAPFLAALQQKGRDSSVTVRHHNTLK